MIKIGVTGSICTGKTFVLTVFGSLGAFTIKADELARKVINSKDTPVRNQVIKLFGQAIYKDDQTIDTDLLADALFSNPEKRALLDKIVHPKVRAERKRLIKKLEQKKEHSLIFYESALLAESGTFVDFDRVIVVYCDPETQKRRLMERDQITQELAEKKIKAQFPLSEKLKIAHYTIDTSSSVDQTYKQTLEIYSLILSEFKIVEKPDKMLSKAEGRHWKKN